VKRETVTDIQTDMSLEGLTRVGSGGKGGLRLAKPVRLCRPRPLRLASSESPEQLVERVEGLLRGLQGSPPRVPPQFQLSGLANNLKVLGPQLEASNKELMDSFNSCLVEACRDESLDLVARVHMLEIIELRTMNWKTNENVTNYYKQKLAQIETESLSPKTAPVILNPSAPDFSPRPPSSEQGEKREKLRNSKSTSSFRISPVQELEKDSLLISGSPELCSKSSETVKVGTEQLTITGVTPELVKTAKIVLNEFFSMCPPEDSPENLGARRKNISGEREEEEHLRRKNTSGDREKDKEEEEDLLSGPPETVLVKPDISYEKEELLKMAESPLCKVTPPNWVSVAALMPGVVRRADRAGPTSKLIQREMMEIRRQEAKETKHV